MGLHNWIKTSFKLYLTKLSQLDDLNLTQFDPYELGWVWLVFRTTMKLVGLGISQSKRDGFRWKKILNIQPNPNRMQLPLKGPSTPDKDSPSLTLKAKQMQRPNRDFKIDFGPNPYFLDKEKTHSEMKEMGLGPWKGTKY